MKKFILILLVFGFNTFGYSYNDILPKEEISIDNLDVITYGITNNNIGSCNLVTSYIVEEKSELVKDCEVRLNMTLENGTHIEGTVTFSDVSWWDCAKMQLGAWYTRNF